MPGDCWVRVGSSEPTRWTEFYPGRPGRENCDMVLVSWLGGELTRCDHLPCLSVNRTARSLSLQLQSQPAAKQALNRTFVEFYSVPLNVYCDMELGKDSGSALLSPIECGLSTMREIQSARPAGMPTKCSTLIQHSNQTFMVITPYIVNVMYCILSCSLHKSAWLDSHGRHNTALLAKHSRCWQKRPQND